MQVKHDDTISFDTYDFKFVIREMAQADSEGLDRTVFRPKDDPTKVSSKPKAEPEKDKKPKPTETVEKGEKVKTPVQENPTVKDRS